MYKLVLVNREENNKFEKDFGGFNDAPPNMKEIDEDSFFRTINMYHPVGLAYKQIVNREANIIIDLHMYLYDDGSGVGYSLDRGCTYKNGVHVCNKKFYEFAACIHDYEALPSGWPCYHESICKKCGYRHAVDSSG